MRSVSFDMGRFNELVKKTPIVGEVGLDRISPVPLDLQLQTFRQVLDTVMEIPRLVSIHSWHTTAMTIEELKRRPFSVPVLHYWTGTIRETREAVDLGCYFSINAEMRIPKYCKIVPKDRLLIETDHLYCNIQCIEHIEVPCDCSLLQSRIE